ncbi:hypothetical protein NLJ89_g2050 [Agrocybe chaxingu]|uniref:Uncharacterized protein n=1 Tax=Agrocybe chaxingu TaxID=84603 RepID=A0A9W8MXY3_9AGAR|nr:hypothetical protein NLJ89_g2050 [Agrocybe chaxingu]
MDHFRVEEPYGRDNPYYRTPLSILKPAQMTSLRYGGSDSAMPRLFLVDDHQLELAPSLLDISSWSRISGIVDSYRSPACRPTDTRGAAYPLSGWMQFLDGLCDVLKKIPKENSIRTFQLNIDTGFIRRVKPQASFEANWDAFSDQLRRLSEGKPLRFDLYMKYYSPSSDLSRFADFSDSEEETDVESYSESSSDPEDGGSSIAERSRLSKGRYRATYEQFVKERLSLPDHPITVNLPH